MHKPAHAELVEASPHFNETKNGLSLTAKIFLKSVELSGIIYIRRGKFRGIRQQNLGYPNRSA
jgi:hypothetical protein